MTRRLALLLALLLPLAALPVARSAAAEAIAAAGDEGLEWRRSGHGAGAFRFEFDWEHSWFSYEKSSKVAKPKADAKGKAPPSSSEESGGAETVTTIHRTVTTVHSKLKACHTEGLVLFGGRNKLSEGVAENATDVDFAYFNTVRVALRNDGSCGQKATPLLSYKPVQARSVARAAGRHVKFLSGGKGVPAPRESFSLHPLDWNLFADIRPVAECIREAPTESKSGLKLNFIRAQFGYENFFPETLTLPKGPANALYQTKLVDMHEYLTAVVGTNDLIDKEARYPNNFTTKFEPGVAEKQFFVDFDCHQGIVWTIKSPYGVTRKAVASIDSPVCPGAKLSKDSCLWKDVHKRGGEGIVAKSWKDEMQNKKATYEKTVTTVGGEGSEDSEESSLLEVASAPATGKPATNAEAESAEDDFDVHRRVPPQEWNNNNKVQSFLMFGGYGGYADRTFFNDLWLLHILPPPEVNRIVVPNSTFAGWRSWASGDLQHEYEDKGKPQPAKPKASASPSPEAAKDESAGEDEEYKKWQFDVRWEKPRITGARPVGRYRHASVQVGPLFLVHGGFSARHGFFDDTWMLDTRRLFNPSRYVGEAWRDMDVVGDGPPARAGHSAELITMVNQLVYVVFFGGYAKTNVTADVSMLHTGCRQKNATYIDCPANDKLKFYWIRLQEDVPDQLELPGGRYGHQAFRQFDKSPNTILILGGYGYLKRPAWLKLNESEKYEYDFKPPKEKVAERERAKLLPMHIWSLQCGNLHDVPAEMKVVSFDRDDPYLNVYSTCTWARNQKLDLPSRRDYTLTRFDDKLTLALGGVVENPSSAFRAPERSYWEMKKLDDGKVEVIKPKPKPAPPAIVMEVEESFDFKL